jgi:phytoene dehydrogenase-like protein
MSEKSIIIVGGGIAGLAAGCYGQLNGFRTRIFEMHKKPGGLCTSWKRQGYVVDGCIHWLVGSGPGTGFHRIWQDLGALDNKTIIDHEEFGRIEGADGKTFIVHSNTDKLEKHMKELAPEDGAVIDEFISAIRQCTRYEPPLEKAAEVAGLLDLLKIVFTKFPLLRMLWKWNKVSLREFGMRFKNPLLRESFPLMFVPDFPMTFLLMNLAWMHNKRAGYPLGGSLEFSRSIEKRYAALGGEMFYKARVSKVLTEKGRAVGVRLADGTEHRADYVISAADGHTTIFEMLEGKYLDDTIRGYYEKLIPFPAVVYVALGVDRIFTDLPSSAGGMAIMFQQPVMIGGVEHAYLKVHIFNFDPSLAPDGRTLITVMIHTDFDYWLKLRGHDEQYKAEKEKVADTVVEILDKRFPGIASQVEMHDVASPTTFVRTRETGRGASRAGRSLRRHGASAGSCGRPCPVSRTSTWPDIGSSPVEGCRLRP